MEKMGCGSQALFFLCMSVTRASSGEHLRVESGANLYRLPGVPLTGLKQCAVLYGYVTAREAKGNWPAGIDLQQPLRAIPKLGELGYVMGISLGCLRLTLPTSHRFIPKTFIIRLC